MSKDKTPDDKGYSIGAAAQMTGLTTQVIRAWENRYGAVVAERTSNGRRLYDRGDVEKLGLLKALTSRGIPISSIATLPVETLRGRLAEMDQMTHAPLPETIQVAVLGDFLPRLLDEEILHGNAMALVARDTDAQQFMTDTRNLNPHVLVVETDNLNEDTINLVTKLRDSTGAGETILAFGFGRSEDATALSEQGIRLVRTPVAVNSLVVAVLAAAAGLNAREPAFGARQKTAPKAPASFTGPMPARQFTREQLLRLAGIDSPVDCECPKHLADLVHTLTAFETYSADCQDRDEKDAQLHAFLHRSTAEARAIMETALAHLAKVEGLDP